MLIVIRRKTLVTLNIFYWMPNYENILQQFIWQTMDVKPKYPRVYRFLDYWHNNIDAVVNEIEICDSERENTLC
jgi:uncharacterized protein Usg